MEKSPRLPAGIAICTGTINVMARVVFSTFIIAKVDTVNCDRLDNQASPTNLESGVEPSNPIKNSVGKRETHTERWISTAPTHVQHPTPPKDSH
jgi:hypothetical protein